MRTASWACIGAACLAVGFGGFANPAAAAGADFCRGVSIRDDEGPLRGMPPHHAPPEGELPFGPRNLSMYKLNFGSRLALVGGHIGYRFAAKSAGRRTLHLNWRVSAALTRVDRGGRPLRSERTVERVFGDVQDLNELEFGFPATESGFFRIEIAFANLGGKVLGRYSEYFRVLPRRVRLELAASSRAVSPGGVVQARIRNTGTVGAIVRPQIAVQRREAGEWVEYARLQASPRSIRRFRWTLGGGQASPCVAFRVPATAGAGEYRFSGYALPFAQRPARRALSAGFIVRRPR